MNGEFLDTNVLVYAFSKDARSARAQTLLSGGGVISVQCLNEFTNVARRKLGFTWEEVEEALAAIRTLCPTVLPLDVQLHEGAISLAKKHDYAIIDALVVVSALHAGCHTLWSEDMQDGVMVEGRMRIVNPFAAG